MRQELYHLAGDPFHDEEMEHIHKGDEWFCRFISGADGEIIGLVELSARNTVDGCLTSPVAYLNGLYIMPEHRGLGQGTAVMHLILDWAAKRGYRELATDAELVNVRAQNFYKKLGFEEVDRVVSYKIKLE